MVQLQSEKKGKIKKQNVCTPRMPKGIFNPSFPCLYIFSYDYHIIHMGEPSYNVLLLVWDLRTARDQFNLFLYVPQFMSSRCCIYLMRDMDPTLYCPALNECFFFL